MVSVSGPALAGHRPAQVSSQITPYTAHRLDCASLPGTAPSDSTPTVRPSAGHLTPTHPRMFVFSKHCLNDLFEPRGGSNGKQVSGVRQVRI